MLMSLATVLSVVDKSFSMFALSVVVNEPKVLSIALIVSLARLFMESNIKETLSIISCLPPMSFHI